jgi:hypothetical protein
MECATHFETRRDRSALRRYYREAFAPTAHQITVRETTRPVIGDPA